MSAVVGRLIYITGNDGTGKTTQAQLLVADLKAAGIGSQYVWLRFPQYVSLPVLGLSRLLGVTRYRDVGGRRTGRWEFHRAGWLAHVLMWTQVIDAWLARARLINPVMARHETVVVDRYVYDIVIDIVSSARQPRMLWSTAARLLYRLVRTDQAILLDAPADVLRHRRPDLTTDEGLALRADLYRELGQHLGLRVVDATRTVEEINHLLSEASRA